MTQPSTDSVAQFTPGPWHVREPQADGLWGIIAADGYPLAVLATIRQPALVNARLIAAAPEMLTLLKRLVHGAGLRADYVRQVAEMIARAEGNNP